MSTYSERSKQCANPTAKKLLELMDDKKTNLCVAADVTTKKELLELSNAVGPEICILKTHIDIVSDFDAGLIIALQRLSEKHHFLLFEDRKFADIGNTVQHQYQDGIYHIAEWADIVTPHAVPGPGIIEGLKKIGAPKGRGLLLLAEMSSHDNLANGDYTKKTLEMALAHSDFVIGCIATRKLMDDPRFLTVTPGINLSKEGDMLGQRYMTPEDAILARGSDVIIVGRGVYRADDPLTAAKKYREAGWKAYEQRLGMG